MKTHCFLLGDNNKDNNSFYLSFIIRVYILIYPKCIYVLYYPKCLTDKFFFHHFLGEQVELRKVNNLTHIYLTVFQTTSKLRGLKIQLFI